jgi:two-component sensor histidine kinase
LNITVEELVLNAIKHGRCSPAEGAKHGGYVNLSANLVSI